MNEENSQETNIPVKAVDNRQPDGKFGPGNNANPLGRPKGQSLKEYWRERFYKMTDEEKVEFSLKFDKDLIWKMAEGNPKNDTEIKGNLTISQLLDELDGSKTQGQELES